jgi:hypothetical protein
LSDPQHREEDEMSQATIHAEATAAAVRLQEKHPELKEAFEKSYGYAVFPSVGRASAVLGGAYGKGEVYERGQPIGFATLSQMTIGVQLGGQTFSEVLLFAQKPALDEFRRGKVAFAANASAGIVKAAATGTSNPATITAHAYSRGGMILELSLGGQKFSFIPPEQAEKLDEAHGVEGAQEGGREGAGGHQGDLRSRGIEAVRHARSKLGGMARRHPVATTALAVGLTGASIATKAILAARRRAVPTPTPSK